MLDKLLKSATSGTAGKVINVLPMSWIEEIAFEGVKGLIKKAAHSKKIQDGAYELGKALADFIPGTSIEKSIEVIATKMLDGIRKREKKQKK